MPVRTATSGDLDLLTGLRIEFLAEHRGVTFASLEEDLLDRTRSFFATMDRAGRVHSWIAEDDGQPQGVVSLLLHDVPPNPGDARVHDGYIINMYVRPPARRLGVGTELFETCLAGGRELGVRRFALRATSVGRPLYEQFGFHSRDDWLELSVPSEC